MILINCDTFSSIVTKLNEGILIDGSRREKAPEGDTRLFLGASGVYDHAQDVK